MEPKTPHLHRLLKEESKIVPQTQDSFYNSHLPPVSQLLSGHDPQENLKVINI